MHIICRFSLLTVSKEIKVNCFWIRRKKTLQKFEAFEIGRASKEVCKSLLDKLKKCTIDIICTDGNYAYDQCIPRSIEHVITKSETCLVEAFNSVLREGLARLHRKTKCYSKSAEMLKFSVLLLIDKFNSKKDMIYHTTNRFAIPLMHKSEKET